MDNLTHSLVGLTAAKAGLERMSPWATTVCVISANAADADFVALFFGDRWTLLQHHRALTHSIVGTIAIGLLVPALLFAIERITSGLRRTTPRIRFRGLLFASLIAAASHPVLDWTNNYGVRPFLPWNNQWFYGDLVYIVDPYIWLWLGVIAFMLTSATRAKVVGWSSLALGATILIGIASRPQSPDSTPLRVALAIWIVVLAVAAAARVYGLHRRFGPQTAIAGLLVLIAYWAVLGSVHRGALATVNSVAANLAGARGEYALRAAAMPMAASPLRWQGVAETNQAIYRFTVTLGNSSAENAQRYPKPVGTEAEVVDKSRQDRRTQILLGFARFPIARANIDNCMDQTLVQWADLRYTEPGRRRGNFSVEIPVDCPSR